MTTIISRKLLSIQTSNFVMVQREDAIYTRVHDEYVRVQYFNVHDAMDILQVDKEELYKLCRKFGIQAPANRGKKIRIRLKDLRRMAETLTTTV